MHMHSLFSFVHFALPFMSFYRLYFSSALSSAFFEAFQQMQVQLHAHVSVCLAVAYMVSQLVAPFNDTYAPMCRFKV